MQLESLANEFSNLLEESRQRGEVTELPSSQERRKFPRLKVNSSEIWIDAVAKFSLVDMSPSGVAVLCNHPVQIGESLKFSLGPIHGAEAIVVACELDESPTENLDAQYRVHCKFRNTKEGMSLILMARQ